MAKCKRCGKGGLFFKVNTNGICKDCERIEKLEEDIIRLEHGLAGSVYIISNLGSFGSVILIVSIVFMLAGCYTTNHEKTAVNPDPYIC